MRSTKAQQYRDRAAMAHRKGNYEKEREYLDLYMDQKAEDKM